MAGLILGWRYMRLIVARAPRAMTAIQVDDFLVWATFAVVLGGRLGYVLFYKPIDYFHDPAEIFAVWRGGMSFHGGLLGVTVAIFLFAWRRKINPLRMADALAPVAPLGLFFGRLANFVNGELIGRPAPTDLPWAMIFPDHPEPRHPSQLYEAGLEGLALLAIMFLLWRSERLRLRTGTLTGCFLVGYAAARIFCEFFREPDTFLGPVIGPATMGQVLSVPLALAGLVLIAWPRRRTA
jgi:phosphatidylglycerol:prolipoprotein diacylglycerol transferase